MFLILPLFALSSDFGKYSTTLTSKNWNKEVEKRNSTTVFFVMFHGDHCPACRMAYPAFKEAAQSAAGMVRFATIDTSKEYDIASKFNIRGIPTFMAFHPDGSELYYGDRSARSMINFGSKYIPNLSEQADETWAKGAEKSVILFTNKKIVPPLWASVSCHMANNTKGIRVGIVTEQKEFSSFNVTAVPTIMMLDNGKTFVYNEKPSVLNIVEKINKFFAGEISETPKPKPVKKISDPQILKLLTEEDFDKMCKGSGTFCVIMQGEEPNDVFNQLSSKYKHDPFKFLTCGQKCPFKWVKEGAYIVHHKRNAVVHTNSNEEIASNLDRVIDGGAKWVNFEELTNKEL